jgi:hypothetical protein
MGIVYFGTFGNRKSKCSKVCLTAVKCENVKMFGTD